jgi:hypothetical protein
MINDKKIIIAIPAGRKKNLKILLPQINKQKEFLDEIHFWLNTSNIEDQNYIQEIADSDPDFYKIIEIFIHVFNFFLNTILFSV